jgi:hypothetical protein
MNHQSKGLRVVKIKSLLRIVLAVMLLAGAAIVVAPTATADVNACNGYMEDPHFSSGANGVIAKGRWRCDSDGVDEIGWGLTLYKCPNSNITKNKNWLKDNCVTKATHQGPVITSPRKGVTHTRYVPDLSQQGAQGTGYWIALNVWYSIKGSSWSNLHHTFSNIRYLSV